jgi:hypothetical protein
MSSKRRKMNRATRNPSTPLGVGLSIPKPEVQIAR